MNELLTEVDDRVAVVTLNRPERRNALNSDLLGQLRATLVELDARDDVDVIVLTGADPAFCAGLDLTELATTGSNMIPAGSTEGIGPVPPMLTPLIGAVNGPAVTGGLEIAMLCDFLIASDRARFGDTHARLGLLPDWGLTATLPQAIGVRQATELLLTSRIIAADEALRIGLVNEVVPHEMLLTRARIVAREIADNDRKAVKRLHELLKQNRARAVAADLADEAAASNAWQGAGVDPADIARRRDDVVAKNKTGR